MLYKLENRIPELHGQRHFIAQNAGIIGSIVLQDNVSIWFNAVLRSDDEPIRIGANSNIQDCAVLHPDPGAPLTVGDNVAVGHMVTLHGCTIGNGSLIGIKSVVLNHAVIGRNCLIGTNTLVTEGKVIPDNSLVMGSPGKVLRTLREEEIAAMHANTAHYVGNIKRYQTSLMPVQAG